MTEVTATHEETTVTVRGEVFRSHKYVAVKPPRKGGATVYFLRFEWAIEEAA